MTLQGAADFRRRLEAIASAGESVAANWADRTADRLRSGIRHRTGTTAGSIRAEADGDSARVVGSKVVDYLADGTRAHVIEPRRASILAFESQGRTIFSKRVMHPATTGNPALRNAPRDAFADSDFADEVVGRWNGAA